MQESTEQNKVHPQQMVNKVRKMNKKRDKNKQ